VCLQQNLGFTVRGGEMKSLQRLFIAVALPLLVVLITVGCSGPVTTPTKTLTSIAVTPASPASLKVGATQQFTATGTYSDSSTADITATVTWASGTTATATITASGGLATGVAQGTTQITATLGTVTSPGVTLTVIAVTSIAVTPNPASVAVSGTVQLTATGTFSDASTADITSQVTWACAPSTVATISASGLATAGAANGTCQITATLGAIVSPGVTLTVGTGGVPVPIAVKIEQANPTIAVGGVEDFTAVALLSDGTTAPLGTAATWSSGTTATATILATAGIASGVSAGTTTITATSGTLTPGTTVLTVAVAVPRFAYTVSFENGATPGYVVNSSAGTLAPLPSARLQALSPTQLVFEPSGQFAYAPSGIQSAIGVLTVNPVSGVLAGTAIPNATIPSFVGGTSVIAQSVVDPTGRYLYVLDTGTGFVNAYSIDTSNSATKGTLTSIATGPTISAGVGATGIVMDPLGRFVYVTNGGGSSSITGFSIQSDGHLTALASIGPGPFTSLSDPQIPAIDSTGSFLFVPSSTGSAVSAFSISAAGALTLINPVVTASINSPFQAVVDPSGKFLYVTNDGDGTVASIPIGAAGVLGVATTSNTGLGAISFPAGLAIDSSGTLLAVINNGDNSIALFGVANGVLTPKFVSETSTIPEFVSFYSGVAAPVIGPSNVFAANTGSGDISGFTASNTTGVLTAGTGSPTAAIAGNSSVIADSTGTLLFNSSPTNKRFDAFNVTPSTAALAAFTTAPFSLSTSTDAPSDIVTEPTSQFIFVADTTGNVVEPFTIANPPTTLGATSSLTSVNTVVADPQGTLLYALGANVINPVEINLFNGSLTPSGVAVAQAGNWTSGAIDPSGHFLIALDATGKALQSFQITPVQTFLGSPDGNLTAVLTPLATAVTAPSSVTFDPQARFVFVSDATNGTVTAFGFNRTTGAVTTTGKTATVSATGTGRVSIDASGTYLYAAVTGNGTTVASGVAAFKINADGSLTAVAGSPFPAGAGTSGTSGVVVTSSVN